MDDTMKLGLVLLYVVPGILVGMAAVLNGGHGRLSKYGLRFIAYGVTWPISFFIVMALNTHERVHFESEKDVPGSIKAAKTLVLCALTFMAVMSLWLLRREGTSTVFLIGMAVFYTYFVHNVEGQSRRVRRLRERKERG